MRASLAVFFGAFLCLLASTIQPFGAAGQEKKPDQPPAKPRSLEELQTEALKQNFDVKIAEAKLRLAEVELERARAVVKAQVATAHAELDAAVAGEGEGHNRYKRAELLYKNGSVSAEDLGAATLTYAKLRNERIAAELRLKQIIGGVTLENKKNP